MKMFSFWTRAVLLFLALGGSQVASATILQLTLTTPSNTIIDQFTLDSTAGRADSAGTPPYVLFDISNDLSGYNAVFFGDSTTNGWMGIGNLCCGGSLVAQVINENFSPALYSGVGFNADFTPGSSYTALSGNVLTVSSVPEPGTLVLVATSVVMLFGMRRRAFVKREVRFA